MDKRIQFNVVSNIYIDFSRLTRHVATGRRARRSVGEGQLEWRDGEELMVNHARVNLG